MFRAGFAGNLSDSVFKTINEHAGFKLTGALNTCKADTAKSGIIPFLSADMLLENNDVLIIHQTSYGIPELLEEALRRSKPVMLMDITGFDSATVNKLLKLQEEAHSIIKVTYPARTNPALNKSVPFITHPFFIEAKLSASLNKYEAEERWATGALLKMLDAIFFLCNHNFRKINSFRFPPGMSSSGLVSGRIEFDNGSVANILTSELTEDEIFTLDIYQMKNTLKVDMLNQKFECIEKNRQKNRIDSLTKSYAVTETQLLHNELDGFYNSIKNKDTSGRELFEASRLLEICRKFTGQPVIG